ncbi:tyrosine-type recombinase/integrase [Enterobacter ludwigii]|uniref:tyrosine-type recombinase/integrase n=1 Tax=Enterobacter ludwigii TaxID=299767 RepID=UPI003BEEB76C
MARPREHNVETPNLYRKLDKRTGKVYWQYYNQITDEWSGLGLDEVIARLAAEELNRIVARQQVEQSMAIVDSILGDNSVTQKGLRVHDWIDRYIQQLDKRKERNELAASTVRTRKLSVNILRERISNHYLIDVGAREMAVILEEYKDQEKFRMAQLLRSVWCDLFKEAQYAGEVPPGFNPATATRRIHADVSRSRLNFDDWISIYEASKAAPHFVTCSILLAIVTAQRVGDIAKMQFSDVWDGYLHVEQEKTGRKIALPLSLRCDAINMTLEDVISFCRNRVVSKYLVHHSRSHRRVRVGDPVNKTTLSKTFAVLRDLVGVKVHKDKTPPSFHEQRSLAERLYRKQGVDTQMLLGHRTAAMTEQYNDERDSGWLKLSIM